MLQDSRPQEPSPGLARTTADADVDPAVTLGVAVTVQALANGQWLTHFTFFFGRSLEGLEVGDEEQSYGQNVFQSGKCVSFSNVEV